MTPEQIDVIVTIGWAIVCAVIAIGFIIFVKLLKKNFIRDSFNEQRLGCFTLILWVILMCVCGFVPCAFGREDIGWCLGIFAIVTWKIIDQVWEMAFGKYSIHYGADPP